MLYIKDFNTVWWGRVRTASQPYPCHPHVNAFVGPSGGGKTTQMDALRICLGDAKFENNRPMDHYIHPSSNWAVVRVAMWNREQEGRPFADVGYRADVVTVCVRLDRSSGSCERQYFLFDGEFHNLIDLGQNPRLYRERQVLYNDYLSILDRVGVTRAFRRLMMMSPDDVREVVGLLPHRLFDLVFDLKGTKRIQLNHEEARRKLQELQFQELESRRDLETAKNRLAEYEEAKRLWEENQARIKVEAELADRFRKLNWWEAVQSRERENASLVDAIQERDSLQLRLDQANADRETLHTELASKESQREQLEERKNQIDPLLDKKVKSLSHLDGQLTRLEEQVEELSSLPVEDVLSLQHQIQITQDELRTALGQAYLARQHKDGVMESITELDRGVVGLPKWVRDFCDSLAHAGVKGRLLADCLSVRKDFEPWLRAIEGRLGGERYRVVVSAHEHLQAKILQEKHRYRARVCLPRQAQTKGNPPLLKGRYPSLLSALEISDVDAVGGYLDRFRDTYLVETVEEGHELQREGFSSLTRAGLLQDQDGAVFVGASELVCGRFAREQQLSYLRAELVKVSAEVTATDLAAEDIQSRLGSLQRRLDDQNRRAALPELHTQWEKLRQAVELSRNEVQGMKSESSELERQVKSLWREITELTRKHTQAEGEHKGLTQLLEGKAQQIIGYRNRMVQLDKEIEAAEEELRRAGYSADGISDIPNEAAIGAFMREDGTLWTRGDLNARLMAIRREIERFADQHHDIDERTLLLVEPQKRSVKALEEKLQRATSEREEWETRLGDAEVALRHHVRETMNQYIEEFCTLATLLNAEASGRFDQDGATPEQWRLVLKVGFNGKDPKPYYDPEFSQGERAVLSIMLLLAALNNRKENQRVSLMFLDEPRARVDDARANEVGTLLQITDIQYFITHQTSASLETVDWIDHAFVTSKLRPGEVFADNIIFAERRVMPV